METQNDKIVQYFNNFGKNYKEEPVIQSWCSNGGKPIPESLFDEWALYIQKYFQIEPQHFLLDVGCGSGLFLTRFKRYTSNLYGVDPAEQVILSTQSRCSEFILKMGDVFNVGFDGILFNRIICNSVLFYLNSMEDARSAIKHLFEISSKDAKIWLGDIPMPNPQLCDKNYKRISKTEGWSLQHYPAQFFYEICEPRGYKCIILHQELQKESAAYRYDVLIEKK